MDWDKDQEAKYGVAVALVVANQKGSTSFIQRHLGVGFNFATRMMERMEEEGIVTAPDNQGKRSVHAPMKPMDPEVLNSTRLQLATEKEVEAEGLEQQARMLRLDVAEMRRLAATPITVP